MIKKRHNYKLFLYFIFFNVCINVLRSNLLTMQQEFQQITTEQKKQFLDSLSAQTREFQQITAEQKKQLLDSLSAQTMANAQIFKKLIDNNLLYMGYMDKKTDSQLFYTSKGKILTYFLQHKKDPELLELCQLSFINLENGLVEFANCKPYFINRHNLSIFHDAKVVEKEKRGEKISKISLLLEKEKEKTNPLILIFEGLSANENIALDKMRSKQLIGELSKFIEILDLDHINFDLDHINFDLDHINFDDYKDKAPQGLEENKFTQGEKFNKNFELPFNKENKSNLEADNNMKSQNLNLSLDKKTKSNLLPQKNSQEKKLNLNLNNQQKPAISMVNQSTSENDPDFLLNKNSVQSSKHVDQVKKPEIPNSSNNMFYIFCMILSVGTLAIGYKIISPSNNAETVKSINSLNTKKLGNDI